MKSICPTKYVYVLMLSVIILIPGIIAAQTGIVVGEVVDAQNEEALAGANVVLEGTTIGTTTDIDGRYTLRGVPVGEQTIVFRYIGYTTQMVTVSISEEERIEQNIALVSDMIEGDEIFVVGRQRGQARALTRQRESENIRSVVSSELIDQFGDQDVSGALQRVSGMGHGGANIRGVGAAMSNVTMDGQRMGSTGSGDRSVDLGTISSDMVQDLEIIKVITPDMDADALSGVININTRRPIGGDRTVNARLGGGWTPHFVEHTGPSRRASFSYGDSPRDGFSYGVNLSYLRSITSSESFSANWATRNFTQIDGPSDVLSSLNTRLEMGPRERYGAGLQLTFQPTDRSTYHIRGMFNYQDRERMRYGRNIGIHTNRYTTPNQTGPMTGNRASMSYQTRLDEWDIHQYTFQVTGRHLFDGFDMEYALGWGHGRSYQDRYDFGFSAGGFDYNVNIDDRWKPLVEPNTHGSRQTWPDKSDMTTGGPTFRWDNHLDNEVRGNIDFEVPFSLGSFKFGSSALMTIKTGNYEIFNSDYEGRLTVDDFDRKLNTQWNILNRSHMAYSIPWLIDMHKARDFYRGLRPHFRVVEADWARESETSDYRAGEHIFAGYGMSTVELGRVTFLGGVRVEHTLTRYSGKEVTINSEGRLDGVIERMQTNKYINFFPNAQLMYALGRMTNLRLAYSRSIGRPDYSQLAPSIERNYDTERLNQGNPELDPMVSNNLDFLFEHYFMDVGQFTVGLFYKELSDFVFSFSDNIGPDGVDGEGLYTGWRFNTFKNGEEATVYGVEVSWQQNFSFLPGFLGNFGTYANYSYAHSLADLDRQDTDGNVIWTRLEDQRPHVVNIGLDYSQDSFSGQISYHWGAPSISSYGGDPRFVPGDPNVPINERVYFDRYRDASNDLSITLRYRLSDTFRFWADASNILNNRRIDYYYHRDYYPDRSTLSGRSVSMGIRYSF